MARKGTREVLETALGVLTRRGWRQGAWGVGNSGPLCAEGALCVALGLGLAEIELRDLAASPAYQALADTVGEPELWVWNDDVATTEDDVLAAFKDAIVNAPLEDV